MTASAVAEQAVTTRWPAPAVEHEGHGLVCEPEAEKVPGPQAPTTAFAVPVHGEMRRWPAPAVEQLVQLDAPAAAENVPDVQATQGGAAPFFEKPAAHTHTPPLSTALAGHSAKQKGVKMSLGFQMVRYGHEKALRIVKSGKTVLAVAASAEL
jgi:hypothetical protein